MHLLYFTSREVIIVHFFPFRNPSFPQQFVYYVLDLNGLFYFQKYYWRVYLRPTKPPIQWVPGALSLAVKWPEHEADHSPPSSAEVKMRGAILPLSHYALMAWSSLKKKQKDNFTFTFMSVVTLLICMQKVPVSNLDGEYVWNSVFLPERYMDGILKSAITASPPIRLKCRS
jgi:hypothetical protein